MAQVLIATYGIRKMTYGAIKGGQASKGKFALLSLFLNLQNSLFDVGRSMFDVHFLSNPSY